MPISILINWFGVFRCLFITAVRYFYSLSDSQILWRVKIDTFNRALETESNSYLTSIKGGLAKLIIFLIK